MKIRDDALKLSLDMIEKESTYNLKPGQQVVINYDYNYTIPPMYRTEVHRNTC